MKDIKLKHVILFTLFLILIVPVFNTSGLYGSVSHLEGIEKTIARYFVGITFEFAIFICVYAGYRPAGIFFAFLSFIIGMLYHIEFTDIRNINFWYQRSFISSVVMQVGISSLVYFLSELYVLILDKDIKTIKLSELNKRLAELNTPVSEKEQDAIRLEQGNKELDKNRIELISQNLKLQQDIKALQKKKAGMSIKKQTIKTT